MDKKFLIKLAIRNLMAHRLRTILTLAGVIIGISAVIFLISFGAGIQRMVTEQITGGDAFKLIDVGTGNSQIIKLNKDILTKINSISGVDSVEKITNLAGKAKKGDSEMDIAFFGTSANYIDWSGKKIRYGQTLPTSDNDKAVVNTAYSDFISKNNPAGAVGQKISLDVLVPKELSSSGNAESYPGKEFTIVGVIKDDASPSVYVNSSSLNFLNLQSFSQAKVRIINQSQVDGIRKQIEAYGLKTDYVGDTVSQVQQVFSVFEIVLGSFGFIALLVALLGMFNTLTISLLERIKEVALMKILGMNRLSIRELFITEALILASAGGVIGIAWGLLLGQIANFALNFFAVRAGGDAASVFYYPFWLIISVVIAAIVIGFVTGIYPARRAARVSALDILRYE